VGFASITEIHTGTEVPLMDENAVFLELSESTARFAELEQPDRILAE